MKNMRISFKEHKINIVSDVEWFDDIRSYFTIKKNEEVLGLDFASEVIGKTKEQGNEIYHTFFCETGVDIKNVSYVLRALNLLFFRYIGNSKFTYCVYLPKNEKKLDQYYIEIPEMNKELELSQICDKKPALVEIEGAAEIHPSMAVLFVDEDVEIHFEENGINILFVFYKKNNNIACKLIYSEVYNKYVMKQLIDDFQLAVSFVTGKKNNKLKEFSIKNVSYCEGENYPLDEGNTIIKYIENMAVKYPNKVVYEDEEEEFTYEALIRKMNQIGRFLDKEYPQVKCVGITGKRKAALLVLILAITKSGRIYVPLDKEIKKESLKKIVERAKIDFVVTDEVDWNKDCIGEQIMLQELMNITEQLETEYEGKNNSIFDELCIVFTSGTTGEPKLAKHVQAGVLSALHTFLQRTNFNKEDVLAQRSPLQHIPASKEIFMGPVLGLRTVVVPDEVLLEPEVFHSFMMKKKISWIQMVPTLLKVCFVDCKKIDTTIKYIVTLGEEFSKDDLEAIQEKYPEMQIMNDYGMTELNSAIIEVFEKSKEYMYKLPIGKPVANMEVAILNIAGELVPKGVIGQLAVRSSLNFREEDIKNYTLAYVQEQGKSYILTGDYASCLEDGSFEYHGRRDALCKIKGKRVDLFYVQSVLSSNENVKECVVLTEKEQEQNKIAAYASVRAGVSIINIRKYLARELESYMIPEKIILLDELPKTKTGKINRSQLKSINKRNEKKIGGKIYQIFENIIGSGLEKERDTTFSELGISSMQMVQILNQIAEELHIRIKIADIFSYPTINALESFVEKEQQKRKFTKQNINNSFDKDDIAIIGLSGIFPGNRNVEEFWEALTKGEDMVIELPENRRKEIGFEKDEKVITGGYLNHTEFFNPLEFGISPREASFMEPQQKAVYVAVRDLIKDGGYTKEELWGKDIAVYAGVVESSYRSENADSRPEYSKMGTDIAMLPSKISYFYNWHGECIALNTACSSSMVAVHQACRSILQSDCEMAVAGGVNIISTRRFFQDTEALGMFSKTFTCRPFDEDANGIVPAEAVGFVLLKPLKKAVEDGNKIYAVVKGTFANQDGKSNGITAPNAIAQEKLALNNMKHSGIKPEDVVHVEAHGTGTKLGDPIEVNALSNVYEKLGSGDICSLGSAKANIGHAVAASGIVSVIKSCLSLYHHTLVPQIKLDNPNPLLELDQTPFYCLKTCKDIKNYKNPVISINSFGYSGTNVNVLLTNWCKDDIDEESAIHADYKKEYVATSFSCEENYGNEHVIAGKEVVPATALLQMVRKEYEEKYGMECCSMEWIYFLRLVLQSQIKEIKVDFAADKENVKFTLLDESSLVYMKGSIVNTKLDEKNVTFREIENRADSQSKELYDYYQKRGICYGEHYQLCNGWRTYQSNDKTHAEISLKQGKDQCYILDAAMHSAVYALDEKERQESKVPYYCKSISWKHSVDEQMETRVKAEKTADGVNISLCDRNGKELVELNGLLVCSLDSGVTIQEKVWKETPLKSENWENQSIVFDYTIIYSPFLRNREKLYKQVFMEQQEHCFLKNKNAQSVLYVAKDKYKNYFEAYQSVVALIQDAYKNEVKQCSFLVVIPEKRDMNDLLNKALISLLGVMNRENPLYTFKLLELPDNIREKWEDIILKEANEGMNNQYIRYNSNLTRYMEKTQPVELKENSKQRLRQGATYLLTGGAGGIGRIMASYLASKYKVNLIVSGRRPENNEIREFIEELRQTGGSAEYIQMDVTDYKQCIEKLENRIDSIDGIIHCAGIKKDSFLFKKNMQDAKSVIVTKIAGMVNLFKLFQKKQAEFMLLCSSISAEIYQPGQADYAYANMAVSLFAQHVRSKMHLTAVEWCFWENGGMQMEPLAYKKMLKSGQHILDNKEGCRIMEDAINSSKKRIIVR
ncbi:SDR family NAD(P)-dependent oxidoreductase [[Clostridium] polysaccharolyticum]|uniref:Phosphopantetheine attachment site n=1 Tax=[Clostridium] polysaccharolyticum TaxID=29364 RepID=A0A1I0E4F7_9FIRM|nr:SDR family NAD(P)-dependent oxidoreductase [[Clostridium] polysaccharolyticum]SET40022.1 Phosphopantetheine attachment site [[Clostridium] polysaccharolyticum]